MVKDKAMRVSVIQGGPSLEAAVSRVSAAAVGRALRERGHQVKNMELAPTLAGELMAWSPQVVFPAVHGAQGEDGCLQGLLEVLRLPYVGSGVRGSAVAASKIATKVHYREAGLPVARERTLSGSDQSESAAVLLAQLRAELGPRLIMKPPLGGSALGIVRLFEDADAQALSQGLASILAIDEEVLVEEYVTGVELTCGVLEQNGVPVSLPPTLISAELADWYDFKSKYSQGGSRHQCPAPLTPELTQAIQTAAVRAHFALGLRDLSRTDIILRQDGSFVLLETNTLPGMTDVSLFPEAALAQGIEFGALVEGLCVGALRRGVGALRPEAAMP